MTYPDRIPDGTFPARVAAARERDMLEGDPEAIEAGPIVLLTADQKAERLAALKRQSEAEHAEYERSRRAEAAQRAQDNAEVAAQYAALGVQVPPKSAAEALIRCVATFRQYLHLPHAGGLYFMLATIAANRGEGDPVWGLVVGPPGGGKTELLQSVARQRDVHAAATLTEAALLSGTPKRDRASSSKGGLLRTIGEFGIIVCKDFTSVLSMHRDARGAVLAALREIYDGSWTRHVGTDGGQTLTWSGKVGLLAGCTPTIDSHHAVMASMGERFVIYRLPPIEGEAQARRALEHVGRETNGRKALAEAVSAVLDAVDVRELGRPADAATADRLVSIATFAVRGRSSVERDSYSREVVLVPEPEAPARMALVLLRLLNGLRAIGASDAEAWDIVTKCALDSMPVMRRRALELLIGRTDSITTTAVAEGLAYPTTTTRRTLEDLEAHGLARSDSPGQGKADLWHATTWARDRWPGTVPEMSEEVQSAAPEEPANAPISLPLLVFDDFSGKVDDVEDDYPASARDIS